ncbi:MAG: hypothetical protein NC218_11825 [Acetobacter sp.]|nr:hypothetical protein [Acetobacter sp.]
MFHLMNNHMTIQNIDWPSPHYPDGTLMLKDLPQEIDCIEWLYDNDAELFTLICLRRHYRGNVRLVLPYVPHARMDRVKQDSELFTLKAFCETINILNFSSVTIFDPHSNVTPALLYNVKVIWPTANIRNIYSNLPRVGNTTFFFPDEGAMKRYSTLFPGEPYVFGMKDRDWVTGKIRKLIIQGDDDLIRDKDILIVDDICSKGGTFFHSAKALKDKGAKDIYLYISHCENSVYDGDMIKSGLIKKIFTTNSIFRPVPRELSAETPITVLN